jgi:four helix bundle protein
MGGARSFTELHAWQLANELKRGVYGLIDSTRARNDTKFSDQIRDAAASAPRNIAEGFGRYQPREFSQYLRVANGSLMETSNHLRDGVDRGYFTQAQVDPTPRPGETRLCGGDTPDSIPSQTRVRRNRRTLNPNPEPENQNLSTGTRAPAHPSTREL